MAWRGNRRTVLRSTASFSLTICRSAGRFQVLTHAPWIGGGRGRFRDGGDAIPVAETELHDGDCSGKKRNYSN